MKKYFVIIFLLNTIFLFFIKEPEACTRALFTGENNLVITGRSMDWSEDMQSNIWVFPRGMVRNSLGGKNSFTWKSKYGSVITTGYDIGTADGMNEKGLVANILYLAESDYGKPSENKLVLSISLWGQYVLDNYSTVAETVAALQKEPFMIAAGSLPNKRSAQLHLSLSDSSGDSAIFEYIKGKLVIHHGKQYTVMTNSPSYDEQLALNSYWEQIGGQIFLPGTFRASDRYARASFLINSIPKKVAPSYISAVPYKSFDFQAVASVLSVIRSVGVPLGYTTPNVPNISSTIWRTASDQKNLIYYFDSALTPNTFWIPFKELNFKEGAPVMKLTLVGGMIYCGNVIKEFTKTDPFEFAPSN